MQVNLTLSIVHDDHTHGIGTVQTTGINVTEDEIVSEFLKQISGELAEIMVIVKQHDNDMATLLPLLTIRSLISPLTRLATTVFFVSKALDIENIVLVIECNGITKTVNPTKRLYS